VLSYVQVEAFDGLIPRPRSLANGYRITKQEKRPSPNKWAIEPLVVVVVVIIIIIIIKVIVIIIIIQYCPLHLQFIFPSFPWATLVSLSI
jgi:hypothetical protein